MNAKDAANKVVNAVRKATTKKESPPQPVTIRPKQPSLTELVARLV